MSEPKGPAPARPGGRLTLYVALTALAVFVAVAFLILRKSEGTSGLGITTANYRAQAVTETRPAPDFTMPVLSDSGFITLSDFRGRILVLNFWASWCGPCRLEAPDLQATWERYRDRGVQLLGVDYRDDEAAARAFVDEFGITYPSVFDPAGKLAFDYGLFGVPTTFIIDRGGNIRFQFTGYLDGAVLRRALDDVLGGQV